MSTAYPRGARASHRTTAPFVAIPDSRHHHALASLPAARDWSALATYLVCPAGRLTCSAIVAHKNTRSGVVATPVAAAAVRARRTPVHVRARPVCSLHNQPSGSRRDVNDVLGLFRRRPINSSCSAIAASHNRTDLLNATTLAALCRFSRSLRCLLILQPFSSYSPQPTHAAAVRPIVRTLRVEKQLPGSRQRGLLPAYRITPAGS